jgi:hypothetical protein
MSWAAKLYPRAWRQRYGVEFDALLEEVNPDFRELLNILGSALKIQLTRGTGYLKFAAGLAVVGAMVAAGVSFTAPHRYVSTAVLRVTPEQRANNAPMDRNATWELPAEQEELLSRSSLEEKIQRPSLNLYPSERECMPMEEIVQRMRRDIDISWPQGPQPQVTIAFAYPDREKTQAVTRELAKQMVESSAVRSRMRRRIWVREWGSSDPAPRGEELEILRPPSVPNPVAPNRLAYAAVGLGTGLLVGLLAALSLRRPRWTLQMAGFAAAGCALGAAASFLWPQTYTSTAVMRMGPPIAVPNRVLAETLYPDASARLRQIQAEALSRPSLEGIILKPSFDLYYNQRARKSMEEVVDGMRKDIEIRTFPTPPGTREKYPAFAISFSYPNRYKAQAVVRELITKLTESNVNIMRAQAREVSPDIRKALDQRGGENLEVLDPANLPEEPSRPGTLPPIAAGVGCGLGLGALLLWFRQYQRQTLRPA